MTTGTLYLPEPLAHQAAWLDSPARYKLIRAGRRCGKSRAALVAALDGHGPGAMLRGALDGGDVVWLSPDYPQSAAIWREEIKPRLAGLPGVVLHETLRRVEFLGLGSIELRSAENVDSIRGRELDGIVIDEAAHLNLRYAWESVILATLLNRRGWALVISTPNAGDDGNPEKVVPSFFNRLCADEMAGKLDGDWAQFHAPTGANPKNAPEEVAKLYARYGEGSRVAAQELDALLLDAQAADQLIRHEWLEAAAERFERLRASGDRALEVGGPALGVDVANSEAGDKGAVAYWMGATLPEVQSFPCPDANVLGARVHALMVRHKIPARRVSIDAGGVGAGTVNELRRLGEPDVVAFMAGSKAGGEGAERYLNARAMAYWTFREDLRQGRIAVRRDPELFSELTNIRYEDRLGVIVVEPKADIRKRLGGRSPDKADAAVLGNLVRDRSLPKWERPTGENVHPGFVEVAAKRVVAADSPAARHRGGGGGTVRVPAPSGRGGVKVPR